ncbi:MAG: hypothetical protein H7641_09515 [Candidatus Heimdallarchaeota archaeon]|nr:hypothetical protein [Candidatus Heimdallarchaeota archaeon]MCK4877801.1 hypothetical protein [Candidatus Heimdallarchaeota archaeon]
MNGRNKITLILLIMMLSGATVAVMITVKDFSLIVSDIQDFRDNPFNWPDSRYDGTLLLYVDGDISENASIDQGITLETSMPPYQVLHMYLIITALKMKSKGQDILIDLIDSPKIIDLKAINNTIDLFASFSLPEGEYSAVHFYYDREIVTETSQGNRTFDAQGSDFFSIPLYQNKNNITESDLIIRRNKVSGLLLSFQMQIRWQQQIIYPHIFGYLSF